MYLQENFVFETILMCLERVFGHKTLVSSTLKASWLNSSLDKYS